MAVSFYATGTVSVTNGAQAVAGAGTSWIKNANAGQMILIVNGTRFDLIPIQDVTADGAITLQFNYPGPTAVGLTYCIVPVQGYQQQAAVNLAAAIALVTPWTNAATAAVDGNVAQFLGTPAVLTLRSRAQLIADLLANVAAGSAAAPSYSFAGNLNTGIFSPAANTVAVAVAGAEILRVSAAGIGLKTGISTPGQLFQVGGNAQTNASIAARANGNSFEFGHINGAGFGSTLGAENNSGSPFLAFSAEAGTNNNTYKTRGNKGFVISGNVPATALTFNTVATASADNQSLTECMRIDSTGKVGIGTTSAARILSVSNAGAEGLEIGPGNANGDPSGAVSTYYYNRSGVAYVNNIQIGLSHRWQIAGAEVVRFDSSGNLLVGTTSTTPNPGVVILPGGAISVGNSAGASGTAFQFFVRSGVTIGTITQNGTTGVAYNTTSDARLKTVLETQNDYRAAIKALWVGDFEWRDSGAKGFGVLAQQAYDVMPNRIGVTRPANDDDTWHASSEPFAHLALWGVKDLYALVDQLTARIAALEAHNAKQGIAA